MYNLNDEEIKSEGGAKIFPLGISEGNVIEEVVVDTASNGNDYIKITWKNPETGATLSHLEYEVTKRDGMTDEAFQKKQKNQLSRFKHILTRYVPEGTQLPAAPDYKTFITAYAALLNTHKGSTTVRLKTIYNWKNYVSVPAYLPFIEVSSVPATESKLQITDFDKMTRSEETTDNPATLATAAVGAEVEGDLPF